MKNLLPALSFVLLFSFLFGTRTAFGSSDVKTFGFKNFNKIEIGSGMILNVTQSDAYSIEAKGSSGDLSDLDVEKKGDVLKISFKRNFFLSFGIHRRVEFNIKMPKLSGVSLSGGAKGNIKMDIASDMFTAEMSGGAELLGNLNCGNISIELSGGSSVNINGSGKNLKIDGSGGATFRLKNFSIQNLSADLSGGSRASVMMNGKLNADLSGGSHIYYYGKLELGDTDFSGGSGVSRGD